MNIQTPAYQALDKSSPAYLNLVLQINRDPFVFFSFFVMVHLFYYPTWNAGFVTDFLGWQERFDHSSVFNVLYNFGVPSLHQLSNFFFFIFYKSFGINGLGWYLIFTTLHTVNAFLLYQFTKKLLDRLQATSIFFISFVGALFFLLSPYQTEVLVWKVCLNYLLVGTLLLASLQRTLYWLESTDQRGLYHAHLLFIISLFTLELSLMLPLLNLSLIWLWTFSRGEMPDFKKRLFQLVIPQFAILGVYFLINRLLYGVWIGHYGAATHLNFQLFDVFANYFRYLSKYLLFSRYFEHSYKEALFLALGRLSIIIPATLVGISLLVAYVFHLKKLAPRLQVAGWMLLAFFILLTPIITLYTQYLLHVENDRYGYVASMFFGIFLAAILSLLPRWLTVGLLTGWLFLSGFYLQKTVSFWSESTEVYNNLINTFDWYDKKEVYILNIPDNYNGVLQFRDLSGKDQAFKDALQYIRRKPYTGTLHEVAQYNMTTAMDGATAQRDSSGTIVVTFNQWGNWWWRNGIGASAYEKETFSFEPKGHFYELHLKAKPSDAVFIYQKGGKWVELKQ